jgi:hypothetical protein
MLGLSVTAGLSRNRASVRASVTTKAPEPWIVELQNASARAPSFTSSPTDALNHCRSSSTSDTATIGTSNSRRASRTTRSNRS